MKKYTKMVPFILIMFTDTVFSMERPDKENIGDVQVKIPQVLDARLLELNNQGLNTVLPVGEFYWKKCGDLPLKTYLKIKEGAQKSKKIPICLKNVEWDQILTHAKAGNSFNIETVDNRQQIQCFTICSIHIRYPAKMPNRGLFTYGLRGPVVVQQPPKDNCFRQSDRSFTNFVRKHSNKIKGTIIVCALVCLWKYHIYLLFYPHCILGR